MLLHLAPFSLSFNQIAHNTYEKTHPTYAASASSYTSHFSYGFLDIGNVHKRAYCNHGVVQADYVGTDIIFRCVFIYHYVHQRHAEATQQK